MESRQPPINNMVHLVYSPNATTYAKANLSLGYYHVSNRPQMYRVTTNNKA